VANLKIEVRMFAQKRGAKLRKTGFAVLLAAIFLPAAMGQATGASKKTAAKQADSARSRQTAPPRPKLVVMIVVDQMRGDYVDKFRAEWTRGLKRLVEEGAWFRNAAYPYAATETCVGHATISTGAFPATHGMVANAWWDRESQTMATCTSDPQVTNLAYAGLTVKGGDSASRMLMPAFAEALKFQTGGSTRVVTFSLKARAAITMAGHKADAATWFEPGAGAWETSSAYGRAPFVEAYARAHPAKEDYGKSWALSLPDNRYLYDQAAIGAVPPRGWQLGFPHALGGAPSDSQPDRAYYEQWQSSPYADTALTKLAETAVDALSLGRSSGTDYLGVSYSSPDYVGHAFGPHSWEIQDLLVRLDRDLGELFAHLDEKVGRGNYVVALSADHGVLPVPEDLARTGVDSGVLHLPEVQARMEKALQSFNYPKPAVARITGSDIYFAPGVYTRLNSDSEALAAVIAAIKSVPGVEGVYRAEELADRPPTRSPLRDAMATSYFAGRSGDLFLVPRAYWLMDGTPAGKPRSYGTGHGTPWNYDQHVPVLLLGFGIKPGQYFDSITPADIAPTLAALCGVTLASRDGHVLGQALAVAGAWRGGEKPAAGPRSAVANP
jgi:predicted AlkP superfamily pyrophosphatase or phosphodiesterase